MNIETKRLVFGCAAGLALALTGCASSADRPDAQMARAETSINLAQESGARQYGAIALTRAQEQLAQAETAAANGEYLVALRLAEQAELNAELAASQANRYKAEAALAEVNESISTLRREIERNEMNEDS
ncbi:MAG: DUF4398 domain-containing protein [Xanthomonadales bacterium]|nr:DUF4398 domain-containing protein [Xanthomonadales bacterium]